PRAVGVAPSQYPQRTDVAHESPSLGGVARQPPPVIQGMPVSAPMRVSTGGAVEQQGIELVPVAGTLPELEVRPRGDAPRPPPARVPIAPEVVGTIQPPMVIAGKAIEDDVIPLELPVLDNEDLVLTPDEVIEPSIPNNGSGVGLVIEEPGEPIDSSK